MINSWIPPQEQVNYKPENLDSIMGNQFCPEGANSDGFFFMNNLVESLKWKLSALIRSVCLYEEQEDQHWRISCPARGCGYQK